MKNSADLGGCYPPRPWASVDNTLLDLQNSSYPTQAYSIIAKYMYIEQEGLFGMCRLTSQLHRWKIYLPTVFHFPPPPPHPPLGTEFCCTQNDLCPSGFAAYKSRHESSADRTWMLSEFAKVFERKVWRVQVVHLHNAARARSSLNRRFQ